MLNLHRVTFSVSACGRAFLLTAACGACLAAAAPAQTKPDAGKTAKPVQVREVEPVVLATFHLANGNEVRFLGVPEVGEVMVGEIADAGPNEQFLIKPNTPPAEVFHRLASKDSPVPRMIAQLDAKKVLAGRPLVDKLERAVDVPTTTLAAPAAPPAKAGGGSCQTGAAGAAFFESHWCGSQGGPGYGKKESYCDKGSANSIQRTSDSRRRATWSVMASCGSGMNRMRHFYSKASGYYTQVNVYSDPQKIVDWWSSTTGVKRYRRVRYEEHQSGGWVRGWTIFWSEVAEGW